MSKPHKKKPPAIEPSLALARDTMGRIKADTTLKGQRDPDNKRRISTPERRRRFDVACRMLMAQMTREKMSDVIGISPRQLQRLLASDEFNDYFDKYRKITFASIDKAIYGHLQQTAPLAAEAIRELVMDTKAKSVRFRAAKDVLDRIGVVPPKGRPSATGLQPAQEQALKNAAAHSLFPQRNADLPQISASEAGSSGDEPAGGSTPPEAHPESGSEG